MSRREFKLVQLCHHLRYCLRCHENGSGFKPECHTRERMWRELGLGETPYPVAQDAPIEVTH